MLPRTADYILILCGLDIWWCFTVNLQSISSNVAGSPGDQRLKNNSHPTVNFYRWLVFRSNHVAVSLCHGVLMEIFAVVHNRPFQRPASPPSRRATNPDDSRQDSSSVPRPLAPAPASSPLLWALATFGAEAAHVLYLPPPPPILLSSLFVSVQSYIWSLLPCEAPPCSFINAYLRSSLAPPPTAHASPQPRSTHGISMATNWKDDAGFCSVNQ